MTGPDERDEDGEDGDDNRTRVYTDRWLGYNRLNELGYNHWVVNHALGWGSGHWTTNRIEGYWSIIKKVCVFNEGFNCETIEAA